MHDRFTRLIIALAVLGALFLGALYMLLQIPRKMVERGMRAVVGREEKAVDLGSIVAQIRGLSRLETASMRVMNISRVEQSYGVIPAKLAGDSITFLAVGDVIAGIDLSKITRKDVRMDSDGALIIRMPESEILVTRLDNRQSRVIARDTGLFSRGDAGLESRARQGGETSIRKEALAKGILRIAGDNGEARLAVFLNTIGFRKVRFERSGSRSVESVSGVH